MTPGAGALPDDAIEVGHVVGSWGVRGAVKIASRSDDAAALMHVREWWLRPRVVGVSSTGKSTSYEVVSKRHHGDGIVATLAAVDSREDAQALTGHSILIARSAFPKAGQGEFYWIDLVGCEVFNREGARLGCVVGLIDTGIHSVLRVVDEGTPEPASANAERLVPFVDAYVDKTDIVARRIDVDWGLDY